jgi:Tol biopolymer transport system component
MSERQDAVERSGSDAGLPADMVRSALTHVLASRCFANAPSLSRFLSYIVDNTLNGTSDALKEYAIGMDVFDRGASFDPKTDTIVRVQARRLRAKLDEYYQTAGRNDAVVIEVMKGHYVPRFRWQRPTGSRVAVFPAPHEPRAPASTADAGATGMSVRSRVLYGGTLVAAIAAACVLAVLRLRAPVQQPVTSPAEYVPLTEFTDSATAPALSPDGKMVTFIRGGDAFLSHGQIYVMLMTGGPAERLTNSTNRKFAPVFTPDGTHVAYSEVSRTDKRVSWDTFAVPVLGGEPARLLSNATGLMWIDDRHVLFSEFRGKGGHLGVVTAVDGRASERSVYFPEHERGMAHYSYASPDRSAVLVVEMGPSGEFQPCRVVPFDGSSIGRSVGPDGRCRSAAWSPDGQWMYFGADVGGHSHIWRQRYPAGSPEQITFGPTEEEGVAVAADGRSLVTAVGLPHSAIWLHDAEGDRPLTSDGLAYSPRWSRDRRRVYYMDRPSPDAPSAELRSVEVSSGSSRTLVSGMPVQDIETPVATYPAFDISDDEEQVVYSSRQNGAWTVLLARLDHSTPPRELVRDAALPSFGGRDRVLFVAVGESTSSFSRIKTDGSSRISIGDRGPVHDRGGVSPDGRWAAVFSVGASATTPGGTVALNIETGESKRLCSGLCMVSWSDDGTFLYATVIDESAPEQTLVVPIKPGAMVPDVPQSGLNVPINQRAVAGIRIIEQGAVVPTGDGSTYVYVKSGHERNLYRVPLH